MVAKTISSLREREKIRGGWVVQITFFPEESLLALAEVQVALLLALMLGR